MENFTFRVVSSLTITHVPTKKYWKNPLNFPWTLKRKQKLSIEIYKTLNNLNPSFMKEIFELILCSRPVREQYKLNLNIPRKRQVTFGTKSLESLGPKIQNNQPYHIKFAENFNIFKKLIKKWNDSSCSCNVCALQILVQYYSIDDFCVTFVNFIVDPDYNSTCKHFV